jgi:hypothetical protein
MNKSNMFEVLEKARNKLNESEDLLRGLRDCLDSPEQIAINKALASYSSLRDEIWHLDKAIEGYNE